MTLIIGFLFYSLTKNLQLLRSLKFNFVKMTVLFCKLVFSAISFSGGKLTTAWGFRINHFLKKYSVGIAKNASIRAYQSLFYLLYLLCQLIGKVYSPNIVFTDVKVFVRFLAFVGFWVSVKVWFILKNKWHYLLLHLVKKCIKQNLLKVSVSKFNKFTQWWSGKLLQF